MGSGGTTGNAEMTLADRFEAEAMHHLNDIFRTAYRILGDRARAEDVVQEVFLHAWKSFQRFEAGNKCRAWLFKILFHCVHHHPRQWFPVSLLSQSAGTLEAKLGFTAPG